MAGAFGDEINNQTDFLNQVRLAQRDCSALMQRLPHEAPLKYVAKQLGELRKWVEDKHKPTLKERKSISLGVVMFKEYEMTDDKEIYALAQLISGVDAYAMYWPDDKTAADPNNDDYLIPP